jgi:hypothetical protein
MPAGLNAACRNLLWGPLRKGETLLRRSSRGQPSISQSTVLERKIALPDLDTQKDIEICAAFDITADEELEMHINFPGIESLHKTLQKQYASA